MTTRMSEGRLAAIRASDPWDEEAELLAEVDALRAELKAANEGLDCFAEDVDEASKLNVNANNRISALERRANEAEAKVAKLTATIERIATQHRCHLIRSGLDRDCVEDGKVSMGGTLPEEERERRKCPVCIARAALKETK